MTGKENGEHRNGIIIPVNVRGRYLRVTNTSQNHGPEMSVFTEIQAYSKYEPAGDDLLGNPASWEVTGGGTWTHSDGVVKQTNPANTSDWTPSYTYKTKTFKNFVLDATVKMDITNSSQWGYVGFGLYKPSVNDNVNNVNHGFYVAIEPRGRVIIWDGAKELGPANANVSGFSLSSSFTFRIFSFEDSIGISVNGQTIVYMKSDSFNRSAGYVSIHSGLIPITVSELRS